MARLRFTTVLYPRLRQRTSIPVYATCSWVWSHMFVGFACSLSDQGCPCRLLHNCFSDSDAPLGNHWRKPLFHPSLQTDVHGLYPSSVFSRKTQRWRSELLVGKPYGAANMADCFLIPSRLWRTAWDRRRATRVNI